MLNTLSLSTRLGAAVVLSGAVCFSGCGPSAELPADMTGGPDVIQLLEDPIAVPAFSVTDLDGTTHQSTDWAGKVVLVNFWATWCPPCLAEIPDLVALQEKHRDRLVIVGISEDEEPPAFVKTFAAERKINYPVVMTSPQLSTLFSGVVALPTTFILDPEGRVVKKHVGQLNAGEVDTITRALTGLPVTARIERVADPGQLNLDDPAQITEIPGVDINSVRPDQKVALLQALNSEKCTCGCDLSVAKCRMDDPTCSVSLPVAQEIVARFANAAR
jgi:thiol-disulfide isomerase/thioredoxin